MRIFVTVPGEAKMRGQKSSEVHTNIVFCIESSFLGGLVCQTLPCLFCFSIFDGLQGSLCGLVTICPKLLPCSIDKMVNVA